MISGKRKRMACWKPMVVASVCASAASTMGQPLIVANMKH